MTDVHALVQALARVTSELIQTLQLVSMATDFFPQSSRELYHSWIAFSNHFRLLSLDHYEIWLTLVVVMLLGFPVLLCCCCGCAELCDYVVHVVFSELVFGVLCLPILSLLLHVYYCDSVGFLVEAPGVQCWVGTHVGLVIAASAALLVFTLGCMHHFIHADLRSRNHSSTSASSILSVKLKPHMTFVKAKYCAYRMVLSLLSLRAFTPETSSAHTTTSVLILVLVWSTFPIVYVVVHLPYVSLGMNFLRLGMLTISTSVTLVALVLRLEIVSNVSAVVLTVSTSLIWVTIVLALACWRDHVFRLKLVKGGGQGCSTLLPTTQESVSLRLMNWAALTEEAQGLVIDEILGLEKESELQVRITHDLAMENLCRRLTDQHSSRPMIRKLDIRAQDFDSQLTSRAYDQFKHMLDGRPAKLNNLVSLGFSHHSLKGSIVTAWIASLSSYAHLREIELRQCNLQVQDALDILEAVGQYLPTLRRLDLSNNPIPVSANLQDHTPTTLTLVQC